MALIFELKFTSFFQKQWNQYNSKAQKQIKDKLELIKNNPFRFSRHEGYKFVFKVKLCLDNNYSRLMYAVFMPDAKHITILGVFDRKAEYKDFERLFNDLKK